MYTEVLAGRFLMLWVQALGRASDTCLEAFGFLCSLPPFRRAGFFRKDEAPAFFVPVSFPCGKNFTFFLENGVRKAETPAVRLSDNMEENKMTLTDSKDKAIAWARNVADFARHRGHSFEADEIELAIKEYSERKLSIAIIGLNKRGKSTFCNGLLGRSDDSLAPVDWQPATGVVSSFSYSEDRACADVIFEDGRKEEIPYDRIRDFVLEKNNPQNGKNVELVKIYGKFALDKDFELLDLPGTDSICAYHTQIVYNYLPNADIVLFLSSATDPIRQGELDLLRKVRDDDRRKIFFVINKADECDSEELAQAREHDTGVLQNAHIDFSDRLYCISALQVLEKGTDDFEFDTLRETIHTFLKENKLKLQEEGFFRIVTGTVSGMLRDLELYVDSCKVSSEEIQKKIDELKEEDHHAKELLERGINVFSDNWEKMVSSLEARLPELEEETKKRVAAYIDAIPMMALSKKNVQELPGKITEIMEQVLEGTLASMEEQVKANLNELDQSVKSVDSYLSEHIFDIRYTSTTAPVTVGSVIAGGGFVGIGAALMNLAILPAGLQSIPWIGGLLAGVGTAATAPLMALAAPLFLGGTLILALPVLGWVRSVKRKKEEIKESALNSIVRAFANIRATRLPMMRQQGTVLAVKLRQEFQDRIKQTQLCLENALEEKKNTGESHNGDKAMADLQYLSDLLEQRENAAL